jgi:hypothetical protein
MKRLIVAALVAALATPAVAGCPYGQILRVSMGKCVGWHSKLAQGYVHRLVPVGRAHVARGKVGTEPGRLGRLNARSGLPAADPIELPEIEVLRERLQHRPMALDREAILLSRAAALVEER